MKSLSLWLPHVLPHVPGCPEPFAEQAILTAAIRLCERARVLWHEADAFTLPAGEKEFDLDDVPTGTRVADIISLAVDGQRIEPTTPDILEDRHGDWYDLSGTVDGYFRTTAYGKTVRLFRIPESDVEIRVWLSVAPTRSAQSLPDDLYDGLLDAVASGAIAELKALPGRPWSDQAGAGYFANRFDLAIHEASHTAAKAGTRSPLRSYVSY